jgi:hypothetical protein
MKALSAEDVKRIRGGLNRTEFGALLGVSDITIFRWEKKGLPVKGAGATLLRMLEQDRESTIAILTQVMMNRAMAYEDDFCTTAEIMPDPLEPLEKVAEEGRGVLAARCTVCLATIGDDEKRCLECRKKDLKAKYAVRICPKCEGKFNAYPMNGCPYCGWKPIDTPAPEYKESEDVS